VLLIGALKKENIACGVSSFLNVSRSTLRLYECAAVVKISFLANVQKHFTVECLQKFIAVLFVMQFGKVERITSGDSVLRVLVFGKFG